MNGLIENGEVLHGHVVYTATCDEEHGFHFKPVQDDEWIPCDDYIIFGFMKDKKTGETDTVVKSSRENIRVGDIQPMFAYNKVFMQLMMAAMDYFARNDPTAAQVIIDRAGLLKGSVNQ